MADSSSPLIEVSVGELFDKISILRIKSERIENPAKLKNVVLELEVLEKVAANYEHIEALPEILKVLQRVNETLWEIEDDIRECERQKDFGERFIKLARAVYHQNDKRSVLKRQVNEVCGSKLVEEKSYSDYNSPES